MRSVFVPGGLPQHTYVPRTQRDLEPRLLAASDNLCKLVTVTGATKCGKSTLTQTVYPRGRAVWIDGGTIGAENDLWDQIVDQLDGHTSTSSTRSTELTGGLTGEVGGQLNFIFVKTDGKVSPSVGATRASEQTHTRQISAKPRAVQMLRGCGKPLVIDDFHYLPRAVQGSVVRALKSLVFDGHPVILLAIPHRRYDAVRVEKEMTARVEQIEIPTWSKAELSEIPRLGFPLLNVSVPAGTVESFASEAIGSPHLMQEFCRHLCEENAITETIATAREICVREDVAPLYSRVAAGTSKTVFDRLAKGPRPRSDRTQRNFKDGTNGDIYLAVLKAIARLRPGMVTLEYEQIRAALRELLLELPQAHEVSRVLEHMSKIQADEAASAPVLDWEKEERRLHITDPFFAFFLRWGLVTEDPPN